MTPKDKLKIAGYIAGQIGYPIFGYGDTKEAALADLAHHSDEKLPVYPASAEAMELAASDNFTPDWHIIDGMIHPQSAGRDWGV